MTSPTMLRRCLSAGVLATGVVCAASPTVSTAQLVISATIAPPPLPVYVQPVAPNDGYLWNPGYWAYGPDGYYWVPGVWVRPPRVGVLWTPPYWGFVGGAYAFHAGYWGPTVGYYGGINYGYGYGGVGFAGGRWQGGAFAYNTAVSSVNVNVVRNTYVQNVTQVTTTRTSFNGGPGGIQARPTEAEARVEHEHHIPPTPGQQQHFQAAQQNRAQYASANGGRPQTTAVASRSGFGHANEIDTREGNQQSRIANGTRQGQITPGEEKHLQRREGAINRTAQADRAANGGALSPQERRQVDRRQDRVSHSIDADRHNADNDAAAAARNGRTPGQERHQAERVRHQEAPHGPEHEHH